MALQCHRIPCGTFSPSDKQSTKLLVAENTYQKYLMNQTHSHPIRGSEEATGYYWKDLLVLAKDRNRSESCALVP